MSVFSVNAKVPVLFDMPVPGMPPSTPSIPQDTFYSSYSEGIVHRAEYVVTTAVQGVFDMPGEIAWHVYHHPIASPVTFLGLVGIMKLWDKRVVPCLSRRLEFTAPEFGPLLMSAGIVHSIADLSSGDCESPSKPMGTLVVSVFFLSAVFFLKSWADKLQRKAQNVPLDQREAAEKKAKLAQTGRTTAKYLCLADDFIPLAIFLEASINYAQKLF